MVRRSLSCAAALVALLVLAPIPVGADEQRRIGEVIPGRYIVTLRDGVAPSSVAASYGRAADVRAERTYSRALRGLSVRATRTGVARLRADHRVAAIEPDRVVGVSAVGWGLDRIDQRTLPLDGRYEPGGDGAGVTVYVVDTGIRPHADLAGRVGPGVTAIGDGHGTDDCNGHGTHVAGTVAGRTHGVAAGATVVPVRVLDCRGYGSWSSVIAGIDWVARSASGPAVMNLSLGGQPSNAIDDALRSAVSAGVTAVVAAGNESVDACGTSPARVEPAITVGATDASDRRAWFSNHGSCLDVFAPGVSIRSTGISTSTSTATLSGTSMASPHVAGAAALHLAGDPGAGPAEVSAAVTDGATTGVVTSAGSGSGDRLLHVTASATATPAPEPEPEPRPEPEPQPEPEPEPEPPAPGNDAPVARATASCLRDRCTFDSSGSSDGDGVIASRRWTFSDGTSSTATTVTAYPTRSGTFSGTVTATDDDGSTATATVTVSCRSRGRTLLCT